MMAQDRYDWHGCDAVEFNVAKLGGRATVGSTRMDADGILINHLSGMGVDEIHDCFGVEKDAIRSILAFASRHALRDSA